MAWFDMGFYGRGLCRLACRKRLTLRAIGVQRNFCGVAVRVGCESCGDFESAVKVDIALTLKLAELELLDDGRAVNVRFSHGQCRRFHAFWLRDNSLDAETRDPENGQRLIDVCDVDQNLRVRKASIDSEGNAVISFSPAEVTARFTSTWLWQHAYDKERRQESGWLASDLQTWDAQYPPAVDVPRLSELTASEDALHDWLHSIRRFGFARLRAGACKSGALLDVASLIGPVRETNYGRWFDVRAEAHPNNLANTERALKAHTDNPYRDPPPGLQILYCLANSAGGGESVVVDGFRAAQRLRDESPAAFTTLSRHCARFAFTGMQDVCLQAKRPVLELGVDGELIAVRFNNRACAPFTDIPYDEMRAYYAAYRRFSEIVDEPTMALRFALEPGDCFIVHNARVMHARCAFSVQGTRWLQGCYLDCDPLWSTLAAAASNYGSAVVSKH